MSQHLYINGLKLEKDSFGTYIFESFNSGNLYISYEIEKCNDGRIILCGYSNSYVEPFEEWASIQKIITTEVKGTNWKIVNILENKETNQYIAQLKKK
jgi:hypothetical protein